MHSLEFLEAKERLWIPENLGECDRRQRLNISKLVLMYQLSEISLDQFRILALYSLLNMVYEEEELPNVQDDKWANIYTTSKIIDSFFSVGEDGKMHLVLDFIDNKVKSVQYKAHSFYGPKDGFAGCTYGQLEDGIGKLMDFHATGDFEFLVQLFAIFYVKKGEKYSDIETKLEKRVKFFGHLDVRYVYHIFLLFSSFFKFLTTQCVILLDGREVEVRELFQPKDNAQKTEAEQTEMTSLGLRSTSFQLAESGVFGTLKELRESPFEVVLIRMYDLLLRYKKEEAERAAQEEKSKNQTA